MDLLLILNPNTKKNSLLTVIYVVYVNPRCENRNNSPKRVKKKEWPKSNIYSKKKKNNGQLDRNNES